MAAASTYLENALINHTLRPGNALTAPTSLEVALFTAAATDLEGDSKVGEITLGSYVRQSATFSAPVNGATSNSAAVEFPVATANWDAEVTQVAVLDELNHVLYHGALTAPKTVTTGDTFKFNIGDLSVSIA